MRPNYHISPSYALCQNHLSMHPIYHIQWFVHQYHIHPHIRLMPCSNHRALNLTYLLIYLMPYSTHNASNLTYSSWQMPHAMFISQCTTPNIFTRTYASCHNQLTMHPIYHMFAHTYASCHVQFAMYLIYRIRPRISRICLMPYSTVSAALRFSAASLISGCGDAARPDLVDAAPPT